MAKMFRPSNRESVILSKIESSKERSRKNSINSVRDNIDQLSNTIATKLIEKKHIETTSKNSLEEQIGKRLHTLCNSEDFDIDYQIAPFRNLVTHPHVVSLYLTAFVLESLINHKDVIDIFGTDEEIYSCINRQVQKYVPQ
ncbi:MAG: hypothetical protein KJ737_10450 [Proteobacteria bacterium]|nr:hypothetical protein [Pseudomonadota bacterium]